MAFPFHFDSRVVGGQATGEGIPKATAVVGRDILASHTVGSFSVDQFLDIVGICQKGTEQVAEFSRIFLRKGTV